MQDTLEQKDYILREIEKLGLIMASVRQRLFGGKENPSLSVENIINDVSGMLSGESDFSLHEYLSLGKEESNNYICGFKGFSPENIELLADLIFDICFTVHPVDSTTHLEKALQLYELCNLKSKTYSFKRESKILKIKAHGITR